MKLKIGSRASKLAVVQAEAVMQGIRKNMPDVELELVTYTTTGDRRLDVTLDKIGGKGLFVKELDLALINGEIDIAVHSFKDVPMNVPEEIPIIAVSKRESPFDALVLREGEELDLTKTIGCASARRELQLRSLFKEHVLDIQPIRGNIQTRLAKLDSGEYGSLILAQAGLMRLGLVNRISRVFKADEMIPSACQGILAIQARKDFDAKILGEYADCTAFDAAIAERAFVRYLDGGCTAPTAAYALVLGNLIKLTGLYVNKNGKIIIKSSEGYRADADAIGTNLAKRVLEEE